jgi:hypothetical protein
VANGSVWQVRLDVPQWRGPSGSDSGAQEAAFPGRINLTVMYTGALTL